MSEMFESAAAVAALKGRTLIFSEDNCKLLPLFTVTGTERKESWKAAFSIAHFPFFHSFFVCSVYGAISISEVDTNEEEKVWLNTSYHCKHGSSSSFSEAAAVVVVLFFH